MAPPEDPTCSVCLTPYRLFEEDADFERDLLRCHECGTQREMKSLGKNFRESLKCVLVVTELLDLSQRPVPCTPLAPRPPLPLPSGFHREEDTHHTALSWRGLGGLRCTRIAATSDTLTVHSGFPGSERERLRLERRDLVQLYGQAYKGLLGERYRLCALTRRGHRVVLVSGFTRREPVLFLEPLLEQRLGIPDSWVKGELAERPPPESWIPWWQRLPVRKTRAEKKPDEPRVTEPERAG